MLTGGGGAVREVATAVTAAIVAIGAAAIITAVTAAIVAAIAAAIVAVIAAAVNGAIIVTVVVTVVMAIIIAIGRFLLIVEFHDAAGAGGFNPDILMDWCDGVPTLLDDFSHIIFSRSQFVEAHPA